MPTPHVAIGTLLALALWLAPDDAQAAKTTASFYSPSHNISCEVSDERGRAPYAYCQSVAHAHSAKLGANGHTKICRGQRCLGDPGEHTPVLSYGKQIRVGRFRCRSEQNGITCNVIATGDGFLIDRTTVLRL